MMDADKNGCNGKFRTFLRNCHEKRIICRIVTVLYNRDRVAWWLCSSGNNDNKAACVNGDNGNVNSNGNNVNKKLGVRPALPGCQKCMEGSMRQCIRAKEPGSFSAETSAGKTHAVGVFGRASFQSVGNG